MSAFYGGGGSGGGWVDRLRWGGGGAGVPVMGVQD